jgi:spermidine synthase
MTDTAEPVRPSGAPFAWDAALYPLAVFSSAALVFLVEPMLAKMVLPLLGGSPAVWNTSLAFFQIGLLVGYGYAHLLQRLPTVKLQAMVHVAAVVVAAGALPLRITGLVGEPSFDWPIPWLLAALAISIGAPFAVLSATAPLVQAWFARTAQTEGRTPYGLYAASNLGSLLALLAYPIVVEPLLALHDQRLGWTLGYAVFAVLMATLAWRASRAGEAGRAATPADEAAAAPITWPQRLSWLGLAAIPSSLMMGVTTHLTMDVASAPFLWVVPLALYLATFIFAFQDRPLIPRWAGLFLHAASLGPCVALAPFAAGHIALQMAVTLVAFFFSALVCHQALVARRPPASQLTEFYLWMSLGGVVGGGFNAFLAPVIFDRVYEFPLMLALTCLARPFRRSTRQGFMQVWEWGVLACGVLTAVATLYLLTQTTHRSEVTSLLAVPIGAAFLLRGTGLGFATMIAVLTLCATLIGDRATTTFTERSFFGVIRESTVTIPGLGGQVKMMTNGTTLHGAQAGPGPHRCQPLVYYAEQTPINRAVRSVQARKPSIRFGAVGLGTGTAATFGRPSDHTTFFEIDPMVVRLSTDPAHFSFTTECAKGPIDYVIGDARLTLDKQPDGAFDVLLIDAFSSDAVPVHLLTTEAIAGYLAKVKPDGLVILHLSNRNLELLGPAQAAARAAGGVSIIEDYARSERTPPLWESAENVVVVARSWEALGALREDPRWETHDTHYARAWTDDYANLAGALWARLSERWAMRIPWF